MYLDTDASNEGLGAVLSQKQDGEIRVLAYASRSLTQPERRYNTTRKELLAVVYGLKQFKQYLLGRHFVLRTDHAALRSWRRTPEPVGQQGRWLDLIEQFTFYNIVLGLVTGTPTAFPEDLKQLHRVTVNLLRRRFRKETPVQQRNGTTVNYPCRPRLLMPVPVNRHLT